MSASPSLTPLMQQHHRIKQKYPDAILLFRVGDFYETFGQDAVVTSNILGITLTKRNNGIADSDELAGFPHHALDTYLHKLVKAGYRVAICDQLEDPKKAKGLVKRGVTELITPGIATNDKLIDHKLNNFLAGLHIAGDNNYGIALLDISTGEFFVAEGNFEYIDKIFQSLQPAEILYQRKLQNLFTEQFGDKYFTYCLEEWLFDIKFATDLLLKHFQVHSLKGFGIDMMPNASIAAGIVLHYLKETEHPNLQHIANMQRIDKNDFLWMDKFTIRNLELIKSGTADGTSLLQVIDKTVSNMGARLLQRWLLMPLKNIHSIQERLDVVEWFINNADITTTITEKIKHCGDIERLISKISLKKINPREVIHVAKSLQLIKDIKLLCATIDNPYLQTLTARLETCEHIVEKITREIVELPPLAIGKGQIIKEGVDEELDSLRQLNQSGKDELLKIQKRESELTGVSSLKIGFTSVFGYYLEVTNIHKHKVPATWIRKQTLTNAERYITPELKEYEEKILGADEKILALESALYEKLLITLQEYVQTMQINGHILATLDCLTCFANLAKAYNYTKPELHENFSLDIKDARHPIIERWLPSTESYITNDIFLCPDTQQIIILTGPNMSGKSAILRQTALITIMAHIGCFVPASHAKVPLTDKIFTRVGANDNISAGESTFMVEMNETASIVNNISSRSLILLDEIGRGTSTYDGISIAWSIVEFLHENQHKPKTFFATHYHELNELETKLTRVKNYHVSNKEVGNKIVFLRKLLPGGTTHSFGIHVAKMAGMPPSIIERAQELLHTLEEKHLVSTTEKLQNIESTKEAQFKTSIIDEQTEKYRRVQELFKDLDVNRLSPIEALIKLNEIKLLLK
ncbi:MAG: DNA mismatch repair protein MutS [Phycisphaerales bacterium]|nr:DNA mismatch repair protein MutS [Phycisphaerales bacterium]